MLPPVPVPEDTLKLYSLKKPVRYRPYLVSEEKLLLMAQESKDEKEVETAIRKLIRDCTFGEIDVMSLPSFDVEYMFLKLRAKSVNNVIESRYRCVNPVPTTTVPNETMTDCGAIVPVTIDLNMIELTVPKDHTDKVWLSDDIGLVMKYPTMKVTDTDLMSALPACIKSVFTKKGDVYEFADQTADEITNFVGGLTIPMVSKITPFFDTMPRLEYSFTFKCPKCGYTEDVTLSGITDFFD